jgi:hypothetical protein
LGDAQVKSQVDDSFGTGQFSTSESGTNFYQKKLARREGSGTRNQPGVRPLRQQCEGERETSFATC